MRVMMGAKVPEMMFVSLFVTAAATAACLGGSEVERGPTAARVECDIRFKWRRCTRGPTG